MNNKKMGTSFEKYMRQVLANRGWWVHFIEPKRDGSQPFDLIAVRDGVALAADCKTCSDDTFRIDRLEDNQIMAFDLWLKRGNTAPKIFVYHKKRIYVIDYLVLKNLKRVKLADQQELTQTKIWGDIDYGVEDQVLFGGRTEGDC